jgi:hypothetical protein
MKLVVHLLLERALTIFDASVQRATLFLPDPSDENCLIVWADSTKSEEGRQSTRFYIGNDTENDKKREIPGKVYLNDELLIVHISWENGHLVADQPGSYVDFDEEHPQRKTYRSSVYVPVSVGSEPGDRLGVVCFDSTKPRTFDQAEVQEYLVLVASRMATAISIYQQLHTINQQARIA